MDKIYKQAAIYISLFLCCCPYTMIATFYPQIATSKGISYWVIGLVFSLDPIFGFFASMVLGKYMIHISRKIVIMLGLLFLSISTAILSPIEYYDIEIVLVLSFLSRIFAGISSACIMTTADTICISDYPESIDLMIGRNEAVIGFGIMTGPLIGILLYLWVLYYSLIIFTVLILLCCPIIWKLLGTFREYKISNDKIDVGLLMLKPATIYLENSLRSWNGYCVFIFFWI